ncbi:arylsulfatase [Zhouia sp. PK063]|uniref:arylsulfatase n=1 Tax=Zhouia sp. PK063 TaxID=3373602 RepID=UPI0037B62D85
MKKITLLVFCLCSCIIHAQKKPNIILIMSDDMGYSDLGCYGGEIDTPNLNELATTGLKFTQFYNTARCCPTRASLITGLYPHQTGIGHMTGSPEKPDSEDLEWPGYKGYLTKKNVTFAEVLKNAGYTTLMTGKWHLGFKTKDQWPLQRGFDKFYGILAGATNYFKPEGARGITYNNTPIKIIDSTYYTTDAFTDYAIKFINDTKQQDKNKPFFLYLAYNAPHWPLQAPKKDIDKYRDRYKEGWGKIREERYQKMKELGIIDSSWELSDQDAQQWDSLPQAKKDEMALRRAIYAAQVDRMDQNIGKLMNYLKANNMYNNTIILFIDDNGACAEGGEFGGGYKQNLETKIGYFLTYGKSWANASNTPFRKYKHWIHEGGISSPLIVHWPKGIASQLQGKTVRQYGFLPDIMATFVDAANANYPITFNGYQIPKCEGESLIPLFTNINNPIHTKPIFWEHEGNKAVRLGNYKLVMEWKGKAKSKWELYNMQTDRTEMHDLASQMPNKVQNMAKLWHTWAKTHQVKPWPEVLKKLNSK